MGWWNEMTTLDEIMDMLHWHSDAQEQEEGLTLARQIKDLSVFLQPLEYGNKAVWDNCAKIFVGMTDEELEPYLFGLLAWLQDINWPGALPILYRLKRFSEIESLSSAVDKCVESAVESDDDIWLDYLSDLLDNEKLKTAISEKSLVVLQNSHNNWS